MTASVINTGGKGGLIACYDLAVSPLTFDILPFLVAAEMTRLEAGVDYIHLIVVPAFGDKRDQNSGMVAEFSDENKAWRLRQIVAAAAGLLPSCRALSICASRTKVKKLFERCSGPVFPEGYQPEKPLAGFTVAEISASYLCGWTVPTLHRH